MAAGLPAVATPNIGSDFVGDGGRAMSVVPLPELGSTLSRLLGDPAARARLADAGRGRADDFAWDRVVEAHEAAYVDAIERSRAA